jgi:hypothetical protein
MQTILPLTAHSLTDLDRYEQFATWYTLLQPATVLTYDNEETPSSQSACVKSFPKLPADGSAFDPRSVLVHAVKCHGKAISRAKRRNGRRGASIRGDDTRVREADRKPRALH